LYGLERVAKNIEDKTGNVTRFLVLGKEEVAPSGKDKTSLLVVAKHKNLRYLPSALFWQSVPRRCAHAPVADDPQYQ
jgi:prephenate dehydratase